MSEPRDLVKALDTWAAIRLRWEDLERMGRSQTRDHLTALRAALEYLSADIWHSALLRRLLAGEEPLPFPPPLVASYPAYGFWATLDAGAVSLKDKDVTWLSGDHVVVGKYGGTHFHVLSRHEEHADGQWLLSYRDDCPKLLLDGYLSAKDQWEYSLRWAPTDELGSSDA